MEEVLQRFYHKKHVLVTGGAGFIGSYLVEKLVDLGARVTVMDNFTNGNLANVKSVVSAINLLYADIRSPYSCLKATTQQDIVFHLAAFVSVPESFIYPENCTAINAQGTHNLLDAASKNGVKTFILSSSSAVYGEKNSICRETDELAPSSPYATSKRDAEISCKNFFTTKNMNTASLRYFNVYGDRQNPQGNYAAVVAKFTRLLKDKQPLTVFGDGQQTRDFVPVATAIQANLITAMSDSLKGDTFNVGSGTSLNVLQLISRLEAELQVKNQGISFLPARQGDIVNSQADCQKITFFMQKLVGQSTKS